MHKCYTLLFVLKSVLSFRIIDLKYQHFIVFCPHPFQIKFSSLNSNMKKEITILKFKLARGMHPRIDYQTLSNI